MLALRAGVVEGDIEVVATDHAPHPREAKDCEWPAAAFGMLGLETALSVIYKALGQNASWELLANRMSIAPARIARLLDQGRPIAEGEPANFALVDAVATWVVEPEKMSSLSKNTPFAGEELPLRVVGTIFKGRITNWFGQLVV